MSIKFTKKKLAVIGILFVVVYLVLKFSFPAVSFMQPMGVMPVGVAEVVERDIITWREYSGRLIPVDQAQVRPQVGGVIQKIHFTDGALVKQGDTLFTIDPRAYEAALQAAAARGAFAEADYKRAQDLIKDKALSQREFDQRKNDALTARAALTQAKLNVEYTQVKAPISGRAGRAEILVGNLVETAPNAPLLTTIIASDKLYADFEIDEGAFADYVRAGVSGSQNTKEIPVMMALTGEKEFTHTGQIESFDNQVSIASGTIRVRSVFDNADSSLVAGMFARIKLGSASTKKTFLISDRAVGTDQSKKFVIVVGADNKTQHREVTLGEVADGLRIVTSGLTTGETIVVSGLQRIFMPGQEVKPELVGMTDSVDSGQLTVDSKKEESHVP